MSDRDQILARRTKFALAALAGLAVASAASCDPRPQPCLEPLPLPPDASSPSADAGPEADAAPTTSAISTQPVPCLSVAMPRPDAGPDAGRDAGPAPRSRLHCSCTMSDRDQILARRAKFVLAALAGMAAVARCGGEKEPQVCLDVSGPVTDAGPDGDASAGQGGSGGQPQVCLGQAMAGEGGQGGSPQPCLEAPAGSGGSGGSGGSAGQAGAGSGGEGGSPQPCLAPQQPGGAGQGGSG